MRRLILITTAIRLLFGAAIGLGVDESYMVSAGRTLSFGYFDHPPAAWWLSWAGTHLLGTEAPIAARLPFIILFALTTWLIAQIGTILAGPAAGFWAAVTLNLSPVFGITSGGWVLPDGPLDCALAGAALCLIKAVPDRENAWRWWCGAGVCAGLGLFSKYSAILTILGAFLFLAFAREHRFWLKRWEPYAAGALALLVFSPVLIWNATHDWASFAFQGARAGGLRFRPWLAITTLGGEALFVLPWIWLPMTILAVQAFRSNGPDRLLAWLAAPPILVFSLISAWSSQRILYHWAAPGYLMLFPFLGKFVASNVNQRWIRHTLAGTALLILVSVTVIATHIQTDWLGGIMPVKDPTAEGLSWTSVRDQLPARGMVIGVPNWRDAGKIAQAYGPEVNVICLSEDARQFGFASPAARWSGADILILSVDRIPEALTARFDRIDPLPPATVISHGRTVKILAAGIGRGLRPLGSVKQ